MTPKRRTEGTGLGRRLHAARLRLGWTQARMARRLRVTVRSVIGWEKGQHVPRTRQRTKIERFLVGLVDTER